MTATQQQDRAHPWRRAIVWIALLAPLFFLTYGWANQFAAGRPNVPSIVFDWERQIPFMAWTIVPYWSIDLLYGLSLLLCTSRAELTTQGLRLLTAQIISIGCFVALPLRFIFERPDTHGVFGMMFDVLLGFDKPFNQAPSLHIVLLIIIWVRLAAHSPVWLRWPLHAWMGLIGASVLTTYQHHFIDIPTGVAAGFLCLWLWPEHGRSPLTQVAFTIDSRRRGLALRYALGAAMATMVALLGGWALWLLWLSIALGLVALAYAFIGPTALQKSSDGRLSLAVRWLAAPYLIGAWINLRWWTRHAPSPNQITDGVWLGRFPTHATLRAAQFRAVVDLTAEMDAPWSQQLRYYRSVPILDLAAPSEASLRQAADAIEAARQHGPVLVCCALGYSRSAAALVAWLVRSGIEPDWDSALACIRRARPAVVLSELHTRALARL